MTDTCERSGAQQRQKNAPRCGDVRGDRLRLARRLGLTGTLLMAIGSLGAGALPVPNPLSGLRLLGLPARNTTVSIAVVYAGMGLLVVAWLWVARKVRSDGPSAPTRAQLMRTALTWAAPLVVAPPMFSRDVYSYLAQGAMLGHGLDPYVTSPAAALGVDDPLVRSIPTMWRDTPAPYGPLFLLMGRGVAALTGEDVVLGILCQRVLALVGVAAIVWALPRLAARCGVGPRQALWLGAAHPLVLFHLVSGVHNDSIMIGLLLVGLEIGLRSGSRILDPHLLCGAVLIVGAAAVKAPALLVLGFLGMEWVRRRGARLRDVVPAAAVLLTITVVIFMALAPNPDDTWGWMRTLSVPSLSTEWMSITTLSGIAAGWIGIFAGIGDHTPGVLVITRMVGLCAAAVQCVVLLFATLRGRVHVLTGVAAGLGIVVLSGPSVQPWYLLWAAVPLAATAALSRHRTAIVTASAGFALLIVPTGAAFDFHTYQLLMAVVAALAILAATLWVQHRRLAAAVALRTG